MTTCLNRVTGTGWRTETTLALLDLGTILIRRGPASCGEWRSPPQVSSPTAHQLTRGELPRAPVPHGMAGSCSDAEQESPGGDEPGPAGEARTQASATGHGCRILTAVLCGCRPSAYCCRALAAGPVPASVTTRLVVGARGIGASPLLPTTSTPQARRTRRISPVCLDCRSGSTIAYSSPPASRASHSLQRSDSHIMVDSGAVTQ